MDAAHIIAGHILAEIVHLADIAAAPVLRSAFPLRRTHSIQLWFKAHLGCARPHHGVDRFGQRGLCAAERKHIPHLHTDAAHRNAAARCGRHPQLGGSALVQGHHQLIPAACAEHIVAHFHLH